MQTQQLGTSSKHTVCYAQSPYCVIVDFRGFDSSVILILRGGIPRFTGDFPESLRQAMLVGITLVGKVGVVRRVSRGAESRGGREPGERVCVHVHVHLCIVYIYI